MTAKIFIDGQEGTTGLEIRERLEKRSDVELLEIASSERKDPAARKRLIDAADFVITCLPDAAAREAVALCTNPHTRFVDPSTAHRVDPEWVYGFAELAPGQRARIAEAKAVSVPGCHATAFVALSRPLVDRGLLSASYPLSATSLTGYSGGGRSLIATFEQAVGAEKAHLAAPQPYALGLRHKHLPEMKHHAGLLHEPLFVPVVGAFYRGLMVSIPLHVRTLGSEVSPQRVHAALSQHYAGERFVRVLPLNPEGELDGGRLNPQDANGTNRLDLMVFGHEAQMLLVARLDNLGKGASGACVQSLNLMMGVDEGTGLSV